MNYNNQGDIYFDRPNDYKVWSIINLIVSILFCCSCCGLISLVLSIIALLKSNDVSKFLRMGEAGIAPALEASNNAKTYNIIATVLLVLNCIGSVVYYVVFGFAQISQAIANM
ncbi:CD225/dispanin family protein [Prevotella sp. E2-28]|uniref:CD225/dispanin family protein n=1 Tax=Prevotella sp. E2-28 TaxID=2913620 RepID=UPI001EDC52F0|nr:CD225/dispanin family protein [Prevotella sp. E2-28]UKK54489.1 CD225/dispanin family protein [Prevotella sp. E2-28]